jgi:hypothetical protein
VLKALPLLLKMWPHELMEVWPQKLAWPRLVQVWSQELMVQVWPQLVQMWPQKLVVKVWSRVV